MKIEIHCPHHGETESLELPDSYKHFDGEVRCSPPEGETSHIIKIGLVRGSLVSAERG